MVQVCYPTLRAECFRSFLGHIPCHPCIFTYIYHKNHPNVGKYTIHGSYGYGMNLYSHHQTHPCGCYNLKWLLHRSKKIQAIAALLKLGILEILEPRDQKMHSMQKRGKYMYQNNENYTLLCIYIYILIVLICFLSFLIFWNILEHHHVSGFSELGNYCILLKKMYALHFLFSPYLGIFDTIS